MHLLWGNVHRRASEASPSLAASTCQSLFEWTKTLPANNVHRSSPFHSHLANTTTNPSHLSQLYLSPPPCTELNVLPRTQWGYMGRYGDRSKEEIINRSRLGEEKPVVPPGKVWCFLPCPVSHRTHSPFKLCRDCKNSWLNTTRIYLHSVYKNQQPHPLMKLHLPAHCAFSDAI